ncbi:Fic/DOC family protein [Herbiconiux ginsengi]|uniref:Fic/DOC family protein n=1 Tax=Herbiconiux ginsengi TaxID=381665 RepID=UPI001FE194A7
MPAIAGRVRDVDVQATGTGIPYCRPEFIDENLRTLFGRLDRENYLAGLSGREFADRLADRWGELSAIHPFRDGNTRSQAVYITTLAERAGHPIDWERVDVDTLRALRLNAVAGHERPLADYLADRLVSGEPGAGSSAQLDPDIQRIADLSRIDHPSPGRQPHAREESMPRSRTPTRGHDRRGDRGIGE